MEKHFDFFKSVVSCVLVISLMVCAPVESLAQSANNRGNLLESGEQLVLRVNELFKSDSKAESGTINAIVDNDVYSADGTRVLIKAGTPAFIEFSAEPNGSWGKE